MEEEEEEEQQQQRRCIIRRTRTRRGEREAANSLEVEVLCDNIPDFILIEVLYRLPVKSVFRFKSVSKSWLSLISNPSFARSYCSSRTIESRANNSSSNPPWTLLYREFCHPLPSDEPLRIQVFPNSVVFKSPGFKLEFMSAIRREDGKEPITVLAVSNGLILTSTTRSSHDCYYVCNPFTKHWTALPKPPHIYHRRRMSLGFIVEPCHGNFQVVRFVGYNGSPNILYFEIFSSKTLQWKENSVSFDYPASTMVGFCFPVPCKQIIYWLDCNKILAYDSSQGDGENDETIQCRLIDLPSDREYYDKGKMGMIGVCQDKLHYLQLSNESKILHFWELRKYNSGGEGEWFLLHRIRYDEVNPALLPRVFQLALHPFNPDLVFLRRPGGILALIDLRRRLVKNILVVTGITWYTTFAFVLPTWPTPVPRISPTPV